MDILTARPHSLRTKGDAVALALVLSEHYNGCGKSDSVDLDQAQKIFDFICENVNLPDVEKDATAEVVEMLSAAVKELQKEKS
jgi:hypothetical protein